MIKSLMSIAASVKLKLIIVFLIEVLVSVATAGL